MSANTLAKQKDTLRKDVGLMYEKLRRDKNKQETVKSIAEAFYDIMSDVSKHDNDDEIIVAYTPKGEPMSRAVFAKMIEERIGLAEHGKKVSMEDFEKDISNWLA